MLRLFEHFEDEYNIYLVVELLKGKTLHEYVRSQKDTLDETAIASILKQVLLGLNYCHQLPLAHRDIKIDNMMFADEECKCVKLIDFGFAKMFGSENNKYLEILGSPLYMAPEIVLKQEYGCQCDIWSCGIVAYFLLSGTLPYKVINIRPQELFDQIKAKHFTIEEDMTQGHWEHISIEAKRFALRMLQSDPCKRATAADLLADDWLRAKQEHTTKLNPEERKAVVSSILRLHVKQILESRRK